MSYPAIARLASQKLRKTFGEPANTMDKDEQWTIVPAGTWADQIHVLLAVNSTSTVVWVFDHNDHQAGVFCTVVTDEKGIDSVIHKIQSIVASA